MGDVKCEMFEKRYKWNEWGENVRKEGNNFFSKNKAM